MTLEKIDYFFPFVVFSYGIFIVFVLENKTLASLGKGRLPDLYGQLSAHKGLAWLCFWVGGLWSLQNVLFS
jgi:hypothetical protein